ncbi:Pkinase-domain-containing protein [Fistulina hepatica ATCC 64428]|uniref:non-specific serine/threonine protein kinase n=1 Tax=Fistulina hepatica ATCC 64428 TaxID=1128425 RepID=A0A0D7A1D3_9AGAR|nr:Pkinase-domain-containing protein [Fistulina hepatica ATCC 64428]
MSQPSVHELYRLVSRVGKGAYGSVYKGEHIPTGKVVAIKSIDFDNANGDDDVADIQREVSLLTQLRDCPNITKYYGCYLHKAVLWIVMEFAQGGSVDSVMKASPNGCIKELHAAIIIREILIALAYLHKVPVIHRDIKSANILITAAGNVLLCDFGVSALLATSVSKRLTFTGTLHFMAPEVLQEYAYDTKADIWSLGGVVHEMIKGKPPFYHLTNAHDAIQQIPRSSPPRFTENEASKQLREFMGYCLKESPAEVCFSARSSHIC